MSSSLDVPCLPLVENSGNKPREYLGQVQGPLSRIIHGVARPQRRRESRNRLVDQLASGAEVSGDLVAPPAFKAGGTGDPCPAGSIPVHLRQAIRSGRKAG